MAVEKKWLAVSAQSFTSDGTQYGVVTINDTHGFKTKQLVFLSAATLPIINAQVKRVVSQTQLIVGPSDNKVDISDWINISAYTVALNASIAAVEQDKMVLIPDKDHYQAIYEADPTVADRVILVDQYGKFYGAANPIPIIFDGTIQVGNVTIQDDDGDELEINPDGSINVNISNIGGVATPKIENFITVLANTEYSYTFPANTKRFSLNARGNAKIQLSYVAGQSNIKFKTVFAGNLYEESSLTVATLTIYFQTNKNGEILEILSWV
jgi:hypothetical protein